MTKKTKELPQILPFVQVGFWFPKMVPDGWRDIGKMGEAFIRGDGYMIYDCSNFCVDYNGQRKQYRLAQFDDDGRVVMYCANCYRYEKLPKESEWPSDCKHKLVPVDEAVCSTCKLRVHMPLDC